MISDLEKEAYSLHLYRHDTRYEVLIKTFTFKNYKISYHYRNSGELEYYVVDAKTSNPVALSEKLVMQIINMAESQAFNGK